MTLKGETGLTLTGHLVSPTLPESPLVFWRDVPSGAVRRSLAPSPLAWAALSNLREKNRISPAHERDQLLQSHSLYPRRHLG